MIFKLIKKLLKRLSQSSKKLSNKFAFHLSRTVAIDLGTANTLVLTGDGKIINEPSVVAIRTNKGEREILAVGKEAKKMVGRTPEHIFAIRPMKDGVISDFIVAEEMIKHFMKLANSDKGILGPKVIIGVPVGATIVERRAIKDAAKSAGAREVELIDEPMAAAIGADLPVSEPRGSMIVDIGGGTTEIAILSLGGIVFASSCKVGGDKLDECIADYVKNKFHITIGESTAELIKTTIGAASLVEDSKDQSIEINGFDRATGIPKKIVIKSSDIIESISGPLATIISSIKNVIEKTPPEVASDIADVGIVLSGGGALLGNVSELFSSKLGLEFKIAKNPLMCVVNGLGKIVNESKENHKVSEID